MLVCNTPSQPAIDTSATHTDAERTQRMLDRGNNLYHFGLLFWIISLVLEHLETGAMWINGAIGLSCILIVGELGITYLYSEKGGWKRKLNGAFLLFLLAVSVWFLLTI